MSDDLRYVRISFQLVPGLTSTEREAFMRELLSEDVHPDAVEVDASGAGVVEYHDLWPEDDQDAADVRRWLSIHRLVSSVE